MERKRKVNNEENTMRRTKDVQEIKEERSNTNIRRKKSKK